MQEIFYRDTRDRAGRAKFEDVLFAGTAPGGGLWVPETYPEIAMDLARHWTYPQTATHVAFPYVQGLVSFEDLDELNHGLYTKANFGTDMVTPIDWLETNFGLLELANGQTGAFKDLPMMWVARVMDHVLRRQGRRATIIVSTSGDTGGAAVSAFAGLANVDLIVLFPKGKVSSVQQRMMTTSGASNVHAFAVGGTFDDCQAIVKALFDNRNRAFVERYRLSGVNSINWARIVAQVVYWTSCGAQVLNRGFKYFDGVVPSGNFGNAFSLSTARGGGVPVRNIIVATNQNDVLYRTFVTGIYEQSEVKASSSPSMDIQVSSNFERQAFEDSGGVGHVIGNLWDELKKTGKCDLRFLAPASAVGWGYGRASESEVMSTIRAINRVFKRKIDPHTAVGVAVAQHFLPKLGNSGAMVVAETARPEKFPDAMREALWIELPLPAAWAGLDTLQEKFNEVGTDHNEVMEYITKEVAPA
jgi:threonine synthase